MSFRKQAELMSKNQLKEQLSILRDGCSNKVDSNGDCWYVSSQGNVRYCSKCKNNIKIVEDLLEKK